ncbi:MAG TPA: YraN family protein [Phycisphaerae bacterium]|nr:YraN family protein [Phycisphaerae bacterium]
MNDLAKLGQAGEKQAERFLKKQGYRIVTRNYGCAGGELDIVALDGKTIVFIEVKTRSSADHADPQDAVTPVKQQRVINAAKTFIQHTHSQDRAYRFDVVAITLDDDKPAKIELFKNAFSPGQPG